MTRIPLLVTLLAVCLCDSSAPAADPTYWQDVRPALRKNCTVCHSVRNLKEVEISGGFTLDSYDAVVKGTKKTLIHPGKSDQSLLIQVVTTADTEKRMPPGTDAIPAETVALLRRWIDSGAKEGQKPDTDTTTIVATPSRGRKLEVTLPTTATPPPGTFGPIPAAPLRLSLRVGPLSPVTAVAFSPDNHLLVVGTYGRATLWDVETGRPVKVLTNVLGAVNDARFSPDGKVLAVAGGQPSAKGDLRLFQVGDWKLLAVLPGHADVVSSVCFSPDGKHLASASYDRTVRIWDTATFKPERTLTGHSDFVYAVAYGPDGKWLVSASKDRSVKMVEAATGQSMLTFSGMDRDVLAVAVGPQGQIVSSGYEPGIAWWNGKGGDRLRVQGGHGVAVHELAFSRDGQALASAGGDGTVKLWNGTTGIVQKTLGIGSLTYAVGLSPNGKLAASGSFDGLVRVWDVASGRQLATLLSLPPQGDRVDWLALTPEGYVAANPELTAVGQWQMNGKTVSAETAWKLLANSAMVAQALGGEALKAPTFGK
jgi:WD40 repeat protein